MKKLKKALSIVAAAGLAFVVGCSGSGGGTATGGNNSSNSGTGGGTVAEAPPAPPVEDTTPITIQYWHSHAEAQLPGLEYMIEEFNKVYPHITIEPVYQGAYTDLHKKLQAAVAARDVPAVTNVEVSALAQFADSGVFADLTPYIERDSFPSDDFSQGMLEAYQYNGRQFGLPLIVSTSVFIYNKTLFDELGVTPPQTWDEIEDFGKKVAVINNGTTERYAFSVPGWDTWYYEPWIVNGGGSVSNEDFTKTALDQPESQKWIANFSKWLKEGFMHMGYGTGASSNMRTAFLEGKIGMVQHTSAVLKTYLENATFEVGVSFIPGDVNRTSHIGGAGIVMMDMASDKEKEAAWKFIQFMTSSEHNISWAEKVGYLPTRKSAFESAEGQAYFERWPQYKVVFDHFDDVTGRPKHPAYPEMAEVYKEVVGEMILNGADPIPLLNAAVPEMNQILSDY